MMSVYSDYFYGNKISDYGLEHGYVDYGTLSKAFDAVLNNDIMSKTWDLGYWEQESGIVDNSDQIEELEEQIDALNDQIEELEEKQVETEEDAEYDALQEQIEALEEKRDNLEEDKEDLEYHDEETPEIFQYYIVSDSGAAILKEVNEIVFYNSELDMYIWGVTHYGTAWDYVLTDIRCNTGEI